MILRIAKVAALFLAAGIGLYVGDLLGSRPRDALPYEFWGPPEALRYVHYYYGIFVGAITTSFVYLMSRILKFPELASFLVACACSIYHPVKQMSITGETLFSVPGLYQIWGFQVPYFFGLLVVFGFVYVAKSSSQAFRRNGND